MNNFWQDQIPSGYYDEILLKGLNTGRGIQSNWHNITFLEVSMTAFVSNMFISLPPENGVTCVTQTCEAS